MVVMEEASESYRCGAGLGSLVERLVEGLVGLQIVKQISRGSAERTGC